MSDDILNSPSSAPTPFKVTSLSFNGGMTVDTTDADIVVLVGPNNTGKSRTLQEMDSWLLASMSAEIDPDTLVALAGLTLEAAMSPDELTSWFRANRYTYKQPGHRETVRTFGSRENLDMDSILAWRQIGNHLGLFQPHLVRGLWCSERLQYLGQPPRLDIGAPPMHPIQWLVHKEGLLDEFRESFLHAFGTHVIIDGWGSSIRLRLSRNEVQDDFVATTNDGLPDAKMIERLSKLPFLDSQSDGVRSFAGIILTLLGSTYPLILIDEPEAFLHPPQAHLLGRYLTQLQKGGQVFVATHSLDILLGLIESRPGRVLIIRLTRDEEVTSARVLSPVQVAELWRDPLLRFSRVLDGLFHDGVVVCEGDTDCQFYSAVLAQSDEKQAARGRDVMFCYAGSKQRIPLVTRALQALGVPVKAVVDFDVLSERSILKSLIESLGYDYGQDFENDRRLVDHHVRGSSGTPTTGSIRQAIECALEGEGGPHSEISPKSLRAIRDAISPETGWRAAKRSGKYAVPSGDATEAVERLLKRLQARGLFVVPCGEVESFVKSVPGKGPKWVVDVIKEGRLSAAEEARKFVGAIIASLQ